MPNVNVYLSESEYVKLCHLALKRQLRASLLARQAIRKWLEGEKDE